MYVTSDGSVKFQTGGNNYTYTHLLPATNNLYDLGTAVQSFKNIYASGTYYGGGFYASSGQSVMPTYSWNSDTDTGWYHGGSDGQTVYMINGGSEIILDALTFNVSQNFIAGTNNSFDLGGVGNAWRNIYASTSLVVPGGSAAVPSVQIGDSGTGFGIFAPVAGYSVGITTAGVQRFKCDAGDCTTSADLYVSGNANPNNNNTKDLGLANNSWRNIYASGTLSLGGAATVASLTSSGRVQSSDLLFGSTGNLLLSSESISAASSTVSGAFSFGTVGDRGVFAREFILSGETLGAGAQTLSIIESPTSTLKITNGGTSGFGGLIARSVTSTGGIEIRTLTAAGAGTTNPLCLDSTGVGYIGVAQICPLSSLASKTGIRPISYGLDELLKTNFYDFELKQNDGRTHSGVVADYLSKTMPNLVMYEDGKVNGYDVFSMVGVLGQSIKDLNAKVEAQQKEINALKKLLRK